MCQRRFFAEVGLKDIITLKNYSLFCLKFKFANWGALTLLLDLMEEGYVSLGSLLSEEGWGQRGAEH